MLIMEKKSAFIFFSCRKEDEGSKEATGCINEEATGAINEAAIGAINEAAIGAIITPKNPPFWFLLFHALMFQLHHQLIDLIFLVTIRS